MDLGVRTIIWMFMIGAAAGTLIMFYNNRFLGGLVRALLEIDATSPETAISAEELKIKITPFIKRSLRPGTSFSETVLKTADDRYYIAPDKIGLAKMKYRGKEMSIIFLIMTLLIIAISGLALTYIFPDIINGTSAQFGSLFG